MTEMAPARACWKKRDTFTLILFSITLRTILTYSERTDRRCCRGIFTATTRVHLHLPFHAITRASPLQTVVNLYRSSLNAGPGLTDLEAFRQAH